jgi:glutaredoxin-related protein
VFSFVTWLLDGRRQFFSHLVQDFDSERDSLTAADAERGKAARKALPEHTYSDWPTIPQLYINGKFVGGCDIGRPYWSDSPR